MANLSKFQKTTEIPNAINRYLEEKETSQAQLCKNADVGVAYLSHILQGKLHIGQTEIKDKYYLAFCKAIDYKLTLETWRHFNTVNFMLMINELKKAREKKERLVLDGDTGAGKSYACAKYKQVYPNNTYVVTCSAIENSKEFTINIAETVGVETHGTAGTIIKRVVKELLKKDDAILIIDEAEHIGKKSGYINVIKSIADMLEGKVSVVLVGMGIADILKRGFDRNKQNFRQTARRFAKREKCTDNISEDVINICQELGIKNKPAQNWLANRMRNFGELKALLVDAIDEATKIKQPVTVKLLNTLYV